MNFASQLMSSAKEAAEKAKNFKGFDEMAEEDDYIHSEGLNVKSSSGTAKQNVNTPAQDDHTNVSQSQSTISAEPSWSLLDRPNNQRGRPLSRAASSISSTSTSPSRANITTAAPTAPPQPRNPYLSVVSSALGSGSAKHKYYTHDYNQKSSFSGYDSDNEQSSYNKPREPSSEDCSSDDSSSDSSSDDSDSDDDVILSQIKSSKQKKLPPKRPNKHKHKKKNQKRKNKNPNRFLEDLTSKMPPPVPGSSAAAGDAAEFAQKQKQKQHRKPLELESSNDQDNTPTHSKLTGFKAWMQNSIKNNASTNAIAAKATSLLKVGPLSRKETTRTAQQEQQEQEEEFLVKSSTSLMSQEELDALAAMNNPSKTSLLSLVKKHPREAFIGFTMLLAILVYFWTHRIEEDDVTR